MARQVFPGVWLAGALAALSPGMAAAQSAGVPPLPRCPSDLLAPQEAGNDGYEIMGVGDGILSYSLFLGDRVETVVEHCASRDRMVVTLSWSDPPTEAEWAGSATIIRVISEAAYSDERIGLRGLARRMRDAGLAARVLRADFTSCACAALAAGRLN